MSCYPHPRPRQLTSTVNYSMGISNGLDVVAHRHWIHPSHRSHLYFSLLEFRFSHPSQSLCQHLVYFFPQLFLLLGERGILFSSSQSPKSSSSSGDFESEPQISSLGSLVFHWFIGGFLAFLINISTGFWLIFLLSSSSEFSCFHFHLAPRWLLSQYFHSCSLVWFLPNDLLQPISGRWHEPFFRLVISSQITTRIL